MEMARSISKKGGLRAGDIEDWGQVPEAPHLSQPRHTPLCLLSSCGLTTKTGSHRYAVVAFLSLWLTFLPCSEQSSEPIKINRTVGLFGLHGTPFS